MKKFIKVTFLSASCLAVLFSAGCAKGKYTIYTNIPQNMFEISDSNYTLGGLIEGYEEGEHGDVIVDYTGFTTKSRTYYSMNADARLLVSGDFTSEEGLKKYEAFSMAVGTVLTAVDAALSPSFETSDIGKFNAAAAGEEVPVSEITYNVLKIAKDVYELTEGYYNPALYYNVLAYGFSTAHDYPKTSADLPADEDIEKYTRLSKQFGNITLREDEGLYYATKPTETVEVGGKTLTLKLDLGGIGKGYAVDMIDELFKTYGYNYGYFNFASSSMLIKMNMPDIDYNVGFAGPRSPARAPYLTTKVRNAKLSTSGDNEQFYIIDGVRYSHIIDATTGKPVQTGIMTATVIYGSAAENDALTTAIMAMGKERACEFIQTKLTGKAVAFAVE